MFLLVKWYFDLVAEDGTALIAYAARLSWGGLRLRYASTLLAPTGEPVQEAVTIRGVSPPVRAGRSLSWRNDVLGIHGQWRAVGSAIRETLLANDDGAIDWTCFAPSARARVQTRSLHLEGRGYAERIRISIPPWKLPFHELRWGRFVSEGHALVWIAWDGECALRRAWLDGAAQYDARLSATGIDWAGGRLDLPVGESRVLRQRSLNDTLADVVPSLAARQTHRFSGMREVKWLSRGSLRDDQGRDENGWAIHEVVTWAALSKP